MQNKSKGALLCLLVIGIMLCLTGCGNSPETEEAIRLGKKAWEVVENKGSSAVIYMMKYDSIYNLQTRFSYNVPETTWEKLPSAGYLVHIETGGDEHFIALDAAGDVFPGFCYSRDEAAKYIADAKYEMTTDSISAAFSPYIIELWGGHEVLRAEYLVLAWPETVADSADNMVIHRLEDDTVKQIVE